MKKFLKMLNQLKFTKILNSQKMSFYSRPLEKIEEKTPSDIEISQSVEPVKIYKIVEYIGLKEEEWESYGRYSGKVERNLFLKFKVTVLDRLKEQKNGKYIVVTGINPTVLFIFLILVACIISFNYFS
jgi:hypothetical protein